MNFLTVPGVLDSEIITDAAATPANTGDGQLTGRLTTDLDRDTDEDHHGDTGDNDPTDAPVVYGDAAYGSGEQLAELQRRGFDARVKTQPPSSRNGKFAKDDFDIDLDADTVTCPAGNTVTIVGSSDGSGVARFGSLCQHCPLRGRCTDAARGRHLNVHRHEKLLAAQRARVADPAWIADYRATRPKVERKLAHLVRRGRRARRRGLQRVDADWSLLAGAVNLARLAVLDLRYDPRGWATAPA
jgi:hypothetical protein